MCDEKKNPRRLSRVKDYDRLSMGKVRVVLPHFEIEFIFV